MRTRKPAPPKKYKDPISQRVYDIQVIERDLPLKELADALGEKEQSLNLRMRGVDKWSTWYKINPTAEHLGISVDYLMGKTSDRQRYIDIPLYEKIPTSDTLVMETRLTPTTYFTGIENPLENVFWLTITGDAFVTDGIKRGTRILLCKNCPIETGHEAFIIYRGNYFIKKVALLGDTYMFSMGGDKPPMSIRNSEIDGDHIMIYRVLAAVREDF
jgi:hypothetical protein